MPNPIEGLLEVYEDMVEVLLVLEIFLISQRICRLKSCSVVLLPALKPVCSSAMIVSASAKDGGVILCVCLGTVQYCWISIGLVVVQLRAVFCPSVQYLSLCQGAVQEQKYRGQFVQKTTTTQKQFF